MPKRGRPSIPTKDGMHRHPGVMRWHSHVQKHHTSFHEKFSSQIEVVVLPEQKSENTPPANETFVKARKLFDTNSEILYLLKEVEQGVVTAEILKEIKTIINLLLNDKDYPKRETDGPPYSTKNEPFGEPDKETREPNTIGLP